MLTVWITYDFLLFFSQLHCSCFSIFFALFSPLCVSSLWQILHRQWLYSTLNFINVLNMIHDFSCSLDWFIPHILYLRHAIRSLQEQAWNIYFKGLMNRNNSDFIRHSRHLYIWSTNLFHKHISASVFVACCRIIYGYLQWDAKVWQPS